MNKIEKWALKPSNEAKAVYVIPNALSDSELKYLDSLLVGTEISDGLLAYGASDASIRNNVGIIWLEDQLKFDWLYNKIAGLVNKANTMNFNKVLYYMEPLQYTLYNEESESFYGQHVDQLAISDKATKRSLSFSVQLSYPEEYEGGSLELYTGDNFNTPTNRGDMIVFNSTVLHEVTKVTKGMRKSLVGWVHGPNI
jgi:predicted 2-oxoglutarate/Fe(II)-dependent dioxygenase YbiX